MNRKNGTKDVRKMKKGFREIRRIVAALVMCVCLGLAPAALAYDPVICDSTSIFYACMADMEHYFLQQDQSYGNNFCMVFKDRSTYAGYGWDSAYTLIMEGQGDEFEGRMTSITYDAALERTFAPGKTDKVLTDTYEIFLMAASMQFGDDGNSDRFISMYSPSRMWQVLGRYDREDFNPSQLSARIGGWNIEVDVAYGDNEIHFYFYMSR